MKKRIFIILTIIILVFGIRISFYSSLEQKIIFGNLNHFFDVDFDGAYEEENNVICICFKHLRDTKETSKVIKDIVKKCKKIVYDEKKYSEYDIRVYFTQAQRTMFSVRINSNKEICNVYSSININNKVVVSLSELSKDYPEVKELILDDYYHESELNDIRIYKRFTNLETIEFSVKPNDKVIDYLKEKFPDCKIKY